METVTAKQKQHLLAFLGYYTAGVDGIWGTLSVKATRDFQTAYGLNADGEFGRETELRIREVIGSPEEAVGENPGAEGAFWEEIQYFQPEEFACKCSRHTRYCDGWPGTMQETVVRICERTRKHFRNPVVIVSGLRCQRHNAASGGVWNSQHLYGEAADIHVSGADADAVLAYLQSQPDVRYAYRIAGSENVHFDIEKRAA